MNLLTQKITRQAKQLSLTIVFLCILAGVQPFLWRFVLSSAQELHDQRTQERQYVNLRERIVEIDRVRAEQEPFLRQLAVTFPGKDATSQLVGRLEQLGDRNNVTIEIREIREESPLETRGRIDLIPLSISLFATGTPERLLEYIDTVEHAQEAAVVRNWSLEAPSGAFHHRLSMTAVFYLQAEEE